MQAIVFVCQRKLCRSEIVRPLISVPDTSTSLYEWVKLLRPEEIVSSAKIVTKVLVVEVVGGSLRDVRDEVESIDYEFVGDSEALQSFLGNNLD